MRNDWSARDVPALKGRIVTGGGGSATARQPAHHGAQVVIAARDELKTRAAVRRIQAEFPGAGVEAHRIGPDLALEALEIPEDLKAPRSTWWMAHSRKVDPLVRPDSEFSTGSIVTFLRGITSPRTACGVS